MGGGGAIIFLLSSFIQICFCTFSIQNAFPFAVGTVTLCYVAKGLSKLPSNLKMPLKKKKYQPIKPDSQTTAVTMAGSEGGLCGKP